MDARRWIGNAFSFHGRAPRAEFWIVSIALNFATYLVFWLAGLATGLELSLNDLTGEVAGFSREKFVAHLFYGAVQWIVVAPISVRRLHDLDLSGWWYALLCLLTEATLYVVAYSLHPLLGPVAFDETIMEIAFWAVLVPFLAYFVWCGLLRGTVGANRYGLDPLQPEEDAAAVAAFD